MKITKTQLKQIIKEELAGVLEGDNLFQNIRAKRARGEAPAKKGDKDYPDEKSWKKATKTEAIKEEELTDSEEGELKTIKKELEGASKMHKGQAQRIGKTIDEDREYYEMLSEGELIEEAEYQGRKVTLNKPMQGDVKKSKVYVKNEKGNVVKVNFGDPDMKIRKSNPKARKSFRARHKCHEKKPKTSAGYWSCKAW